MMAVMALRTVGSTVGWSHMANARLSVRKWSYFRQMVKRSSNFRTLADLEVQKEIGRVRRQSEHVKVVVFYLKLSVHSLFVIITIRITIADHPDLKSGSA